MSQSHWLQIVGSSCAVFIIDLKKKTIIILLADISTSRCITRLRIVLAFVRVVPGGFKWKYNACNLVPGRFGWPPRHRRETAGGGVRRCHRHVWRGHLARDLHQGGPVHTLDSTKFTNIILLNTFYFTFDLSSWSLWTQDLDT